MKNTQELTIKEAKEGLEFLQKSEGNFTKEGKEKIKELKQFLNKMSKIINYKTKDIKKTNC